MKRSQAVKRILKVLKKWESCKMEKRTAEDVLVCIENLGMQPPNIHINLLFPNSEISSSTDNYFALWEPENEKTSNNSNRRRTTKSSR